MRTRTRLVVGLVALAALLAPARPEAQTKFVVAIPHPVLFDTALPLYVAEEKGFFKEAGLAVERVVVSGGGENVQAVVSGSVQLAIARVESTSLLRDAGRATTRDVLESQSALIDARNALTGSLINYTIARLRFYSDMGALDVEDDGTVKELSTGA